MQLDSRGDPAQRLSRLMGLGLGVKKNYTFCKNQSFFLKKGPTLASFSFLFSLFKQTLQFLQQINVKNVHPVYSAGI